VLDAASLTESWLPESGVVPAGGHPHMEGRRQSDMIARGKYEDSDARDDDFDWHSLHHVLALIWSLAANNRVHEIVVHVDRPSPR